MVPTFTVAGALLMILLPSVCSLLFTAVPPSANPSSKLNRLFVEELEEKIFANNIEVQAGRIRFSASRYSPSFDSWSSLFTSGVRSIRLVVCEHDLNKHDTIQSITDRVELAGTRLSAMLEILQSFGNTPTNNTAFRLCCRKWATCICYDTISTTALSHELAKQFAEASGWRVARSKDDSDMQLHVLLHSATITHELPVLRRPLSIEELPKPGFKRIESFAVTKAAGILPGDIVLDPMCGKGSFLVEAALFWPNASYVGVDCCAKQLECAAANVEAAGVTVSLIQADACRLSQFSDDSVDKILSCPPFGIQFGSTNEIPHLYGSLLKEWSRIIKDKGRMVVVVNTDNIESMKKAVTSAGCHISFMRNVFRLGKIQATILVFEKGDLHLGGTKTGVFDWEVGTEKDRALWARLRTSALPKLVPVVGDI